MTVVSSDREEARADDRLKGAKSDIASLEQRRLTMIGTVGPMAFFTALNKPSDGVRPPPFARFEQSSSLSAPPRTALLIKRSYHKEEKSG